MTEHRTETREEWLAARLELLEAEKELTRRSDELARRRRELPWLAMEKEYGFDTVDGTRTLAELFDGRSQLLIYHFMFGPSFEAGCPVCSSMADGIDGVLPHLHARDLTVLFVSRAPLPKLQAYKQRMGWSIPWVSSGNNDFTFDLGASVPEDEVRRTMPPEDEVSPVAQQFARASGTNVHAYLAEFPTAGAFVLEGGAVYQTYATTFRGVEFLMGYYPILDRAAKGRDEGDAFSSWVRRRDEYGSE